MCVRLRKDIHASKTRSTLLQPDVQKPRVDEKASSRAMPVTPHSELRPAPVRASVHPVIAELDELIATARFALEKAENRVAQARDDLSGLEQVRQMFIETPPVSEDFVEALTERLRVYQNKANYYWHVMEGEQQIMIGLDTIIAAAKAQVAP